MAALVCREMGWTYQQYESQPDWFIEIVLSMLQEESEALQKNKS